MALTVAKIAQLIDEVSIAALRSWLKSVGFQRTASTREQMVKKLDSLLKKGDLSEQELMNGIINIEEASNKRAFLYQLAADGQHGHLQNQAAFEKHLHDIGKTLSKEPKVAPKAPSKSTLVYIHYSPEQIRAKWAETHVRIKFHKASLDYEEESVTRIVALVVDIKTGFVQLRYDKPEDQNEHGNSKDGFFLYYRQLASELLGVELKQFETREALRRLIETEPRVVRIRISSHRSKTDKAVRFVSRTAKGDVRDDPEWKAAHQAGGDSRVYIDQQLHWLPAASNKKLNREVFTAVDALASMVRLDADCHEDEIQYAVSTIRENQIKASES